MLDTVSTRVRTYVDVKIGKVWTVGLVDSGATRTLINEDLARRATNEVTWRKTTLDVRSATNHSMVLLGEVDLPIRIGRQKVVQSALICRDLGRHLILGDDFMVAQKVVLSSNPRGMVMNGKRVHVYPGYTEQETACYVDRHLFDAQRKCPRCIEERPDLQMVLWKIFTEWYSRVCAHYGPRPKENEDFICAKCAKYSRGDLPSSDEESTWERTSSNTGKKVISTAAGGSPKRVDRKSTRLNSSHT